MKLDDILGDLARKSWQRKGTDSYQPLVDQARAAIKLLILERLPGKREHESDCQYPQNEICTCISAYFFNKAIDDITKIVEGL